jgi:hypothetical protein
VQRVRGQVINDIQSVSLRWKMKEKRKGEGGDNNAEVDSDPAWSLKGRDGFWRIEGVKEVKARCAYERVDGGCMHGG